MKKLFFLFLAAGLISCNSKSKKESNEQPEKKKENTGYTITKDGIGEIKLGMTESELEKLLNQQLVMKNAKDTNVWLDTATAKYKELEVSLYFERQYNEDPAIKTMALVGVGTSSTACKTAKGLGVGDDRASILAAYEDNPIDMGPENVMVNDTTWELSKTKYYINVKDDEWDRELVFKLANKKVIALEAITIMGD